MKIQIESIPHNCQRYDTVGDWAFESDGTLVINVSEMREVRSMLGLAIHELVEAVLCQMKGITAEQVDQWDMNFKGKGEPGDDPECPYLIQHIIADAIEHRFTDAMNLDWGKHEQNIQIVSQEWEDK